MNVSHSLSQLFYYKGIFSFCFFEFFYSCNSLDFKVSSFVCNYFFSALSGFQVCKFGGG